MTRLALATAYTMELVHIRVTLPQKLHLVSPIGVHARVPEGVQLEDGVPERVLLDRCSRLESRLGSGDSPRIRLGTPHAVPAAAAQNATVFLENGEVDTAQPTEL